MLQTKERTHPPLSPAEPRRPAVVFVSASVEDACTLWDIFSGSQWLVINVPDLAGARAVIAKLTPRLVICDTEIEGSGSWRDLLNAQGAPLGYELIVVSRQVDETLWRDLLILGGSTVVEKPLIAEQFERFTGTGECNG